MTSLIREIRCAARAAAGQGVHRRGPEGRGAAGAGGSRAPHDPDLDRDLPISDVFTMDRVVVRSLWQPRMFSWIFGVFGAVALVLAVVPAQRASKIDPLSAMRCG